MTPTLVLGLGNAWRGDDGVGVDVVRRLPEHVRRRAHVVESDGEVSALLAALAGQARAILVDAARSGAAPGTVQRFDVRTRGLPASVGGASTHALGLADALELARALGQLPDEIVVYAIEGRAFEPGAPLSPEVERAVADVIRSIEAELGG